MGESAEKAPKKSWFKGLKAEFNKVIWPAKESVAKQTAAVVAISLVLGCIIKLLDTIIQFGLKLIQ